MKRSESPPGSASGLTEREFIEKAYTAAGEWTRFADPKSAGVLVFLGLGLADLLKRAARLWNAWDNHWSWDSAATVAFIAALLFAVAAVGVASLAVFPQLKPGGMKRGSRPTSLLFYDDIATFKTADDYRRALRGCTEQQYLDELAAQTWAISRVAATKHKRAQLAYVFVLLFLVCWAVARISLGL